ncbi:MAG: NADH:ubiquinone reductase (Na(+)-transporting) subunit B [Planctomycetota bacterium]
MSALHRMFERMTPTFKEGRLKALWPVFEAVETFLFPTSRRNPGDPHIRDALDFKRMMFTVVVALLPCVVMAFWNTGYQANLAMKELGLQSVTNWRSVIMDPIGYDPESLFANLMHGALYFLPAYIVTMAVGGFWEWLFAAVRKHEIYEGFLVSGLLIPLTLPPNTPLWQIAVGTSFGIVVGKELFGGVGRNFLNPALTARAYMYFAFAGQMTGGNEIWAGIDGATGATPLTELSRATEVSMDAVSTSWWDAFMGIMPGSMGETSALACLSGAAVLILTMIGSWRIMLSMLLGGLGTSALLCAIGSDKSAAFAMPPHWHLVSGSFAFGLVFMATDPVSAAQTNIGRWIYGAFCGVITILVRVVNPAYPEGVMLAILLGNVFAPLFDYFVVAANVKRRQARYVA